MKKAILTLFASAAFALLTVTNVSAQSAKKQEIKTKASTEKSEEVAALKKPKNVKGKPAAKRGDECGASYSDIIVKNYTGYYLDVFVDGEFRVSLAPGYQTTTCAVPGTTKLYAKASFDDGSYLTWGPVYPKTGYVYTWSLWP
ncbi:hypothetical protein EOD41_14315 [Mucilaginibacter limnophilus]|uniref:Uncharacterized protein n=1 Tax=Mucilaginibacter limnophilus TaxID=1932778 RepID=A0A437MR51_9SPHI|nr:hypothetical protein [Mucilaginibacter limnophilus]RVU00130.1 hypothetical protein EOD41_14315 [Mucilaginibacter limnophilus]